MSKVGQGVKSLKNKSFSQFFVDKLVENHPGLRGLTFHIRPTQASAFGKDSVENDASGVTDDHDQSMLNLSAGGTTGPDKEKNIFLRMQWAMAKSRPGFLVSQTEPDHVIAPHLRTMWPAWTARPAPAKISEFFPLQGTLSILDKMIGNE